MTNQSKMQAINIAYWLGIFADALWAVAFVFPPLYGVLTGASNFAPALDFRLAMGIGGSLMAGWTVLLFWAKQEPIQRRGVLLITVFPVIIGIFITTICGIIYGGSSNYWLVGKVAVLTATSLSAYHMAGTIAEEATNEIDN